MFILFLFKISLLFINLVEAVLEIFGIGRTSYEIHRFKLIEKELVSIFYRKLLQQRMKTVAFISDKEIVEICDCDKEFDWKKLLKS